MCLWWIKVTKVSLVFSILIMRKLVGFKRLFIVQITLLIEEGYGSLQFMKLRVASDPWILCGDFNVVRCLEEKWGSDCLTSYDLEFGDCLNNL